MCAPSFCEQALARLTSRLSVIWQQTLYSCLVTLVTASGMSEGIASSTMLRAFQTMKSTILGHLLRLAEHLLISNATAVTLRKLWTLTTDRLCELPALWCTGPARCSLLLCQDTRLLLFRRDPFQDMPCFVSTSFYWASINLWVCGLSV